MPTARLTGSALYTVPELPAYLQELDFAPSAPGYADLRQKHLQGFRANAGGNGAGQPPSVKTIQKMLFQGEAAKYSTCTDIIRLLNIERRSNKIDDLGMSVIEELEYTIPLLPRALQSIATKSDFLWPGNGAAISVSEKAGLTKGLVIAISKGYLTSFQKCNALLNAALELIEDKENKVAKILKITAGHPNVAPRAVTQQLELIFEPDQDLAA